VSALHDLRHLRLSLNVFLSRALSPPQTERTRGGNSILHRYSKSLRAGCTEPEVLNLAGGWTLSVGRDRTSFDVEDFALVQIVKSGQTRRICALGEHGEAS